jgi:hypothetical protein
MSPSHCTIVIAAAVVAFTIATNTATATDATKKE